MYEITFKNPMTNVELVGKVTDNTIARIIMDMMEAGLVLTDLKKID